MPCLSSKILDQIALSESNRSFNNFAVPIDTGIILQNLSLFLQKLCDFIIKVEYCTKLFNTLKNVRNCVINIVILVVIYLVYES